MKTELELLREENRNLRHAIDALHVKTMAAFRAIRSEKLSQYTLEQKVAEVLNGIDIQAEVLIERMTKDAAVETAMNRVKNYESEFFNDADRIDHLEKHYGKALAEVLNTGVKDEVGLRAQIDDAIIRDASL